MKMATVDMEQNGMCQQHTGFLLPLGLKGFCQVMLVKSSRELGQAWALCSVSGVEVRDRTKAEPIDFSNTACHSQLIVFLLLKLSFRSYMTSHHNPPHFNMLPFQQSLREW